MVKNFTPHSIHIIDKESVTFRSDIRKYVAENPVVVKSIPSSGMLNVKYNIETGDPIEGIPVINKVCVGIDPIPDDCTCIIVSALYASASADSRCYTITDPVYTLDGKTVIGCLGIGKIVN